MSGSVSLRIDSGSGPPRTLMHDPQPGPDGRHDDLADDSEGTAHPRISKAVIGIVIFVALAWIVGVIVSVGSFTSADDDTPIPALDEFSADIWVLLEPGLIGDDRDGSSPPVAALINELQAEGGVLEVRFLPMELPGVPPVVGQQTTPADPKLIVRVQPNAIGAMAQVAIADRYMGRDGVISVAVFDTPGS